MKYEPPKPRKEMTFRELVEEYFYISHDGFMRMHAQDREHDAIAEEIAKRIESGINTDMEYFICDMTDATKSDLVYYFNKYKHCIKMLLLFPDTEEEK